MGFDWLLLATTGRASISLGLIAGIATICTFLVIMVVGVGIYAMQQKIRAERAVGLSRPFGKLFRACKSN